jgi:hypothetical protein
MEIQVRTDGHVDGDAGLTAHVERQLLAGLEPYVSRISYTQVHLSVESGARKGPPRLVCMIEVRPVGHAPVVLRRAANTKAGAIRGAVVGMRGALDRRLGRSDRHHPGAATIRRPA